MKNSLLKYTNKIALLGLIITSIIFITFLVYKKLIPHIDTYLLPVSIGLFFVIWISYLLFNYSPKKKIKIENNGKISLLSDNPIVLDKKIISPMENIINAHSFSSAFSMALIGKWGSGKSSYLNTLEAKLTSQERYEVISINVWQLENSENITHELKKELDNIIFKYDKVVWLIQVIKRIFIQDYFAIISKYLTKSPIKVNFTFEPTIKDSKENLKSVLNEVLNGRKIILLIDELDRIDEPKDILNIFKVIHYVDDFENIFTITAMDIEQIEQKIENIDYIHKIFNLKYNLPTVDKDKIIQYYQNEIFKKSSQYIEKEAFKKILTSPSVIALISNYRVIKNSFNDTIVFISSLTEKHPTDWDMYISFKFIFLLNLVKAVDFKFYSYMISNQQLSIIVKLPKIKDTAKKEEVEQQKDYLERNPLLESLSKNLNFNKLRDLIVTINHERNINQYFDIYQSYNIQNYHITESRYNSFIKNSDNFKKYFDELNFPSDKSKFLLNIIDKISYNNEHQIVLLPIVIDDILSMNKFPYLDKLTTKQFIHKQNDKALLQLTQSNQKLSKIFIHYLLEDFSKQENIDDYDSELVGKLLKNYLKFLEKPEMYEIHDYIELISNTYRENNLFLYKILYDYSMTLKEPTYISNSILKYFYIEKIPKLLEALKVEKDDFIIDEYNYSIYFENLHQSKKLLGKKLKEELEKISPTLKS